MLNPTFRQPSSYFRESETAQSDYQANPQTTLAEIHFRFSSRSPCSHYGCESQLVGIQITCNQHVMNYIYFS